MTVAASIGTDLFRAVLQGAPPGAVYALVALGFVLAYKTSGVFNLAFGAQAYASAVVYFKTHTEWEWGIVPSLLVSVVVLAPLLGFALEWLIFRHLRTAPAVSKLVVALGVAVALPSIVNLVTDFRTVTGKTPEGIVPDGNSVFYDPFGVYAFSRNELVAMGVAVVAMAALAALVANVCWLGAWPKRAFASFRFLPATSGTNTAISAAATKKTLWRPISR